MDAKDLIYDLIDSDLGFIKSTIKEIRIHTVFNEPKIMDVKTLFENLSIKICKKLNICEKCGAKLKGERNE